MLSVRKTHKENLLGVALTLHKSKNGWVKVFPDL